MCSITPRVPVHGAAVSGEEGPAAADGRRRAGDDLTPRPKIQYSVQATATPMSRTWTIAAALAAVALAGCSDGGGSESTTPECDTATHYLDAQGVCVPHDEPRLVVEGLPDEVQQYMRYLFTWSLDNGTRGTSADPVHSMDSRVLASEEDAPTTNQTGPDDWGTEVAREQHKNLPDGPFDGQLVWDTVGTLYLKGYMQISGQNVWQDIGTIEVVAVQPTGVVADVTIEQGPPPALSESEVGIKVGDGVKWVNENAIYGYTIEFDCGTGPSVDPVSVAAGAESETVVFLEPANCDFTAQTDASDAGVGEGDLSGTVNVNTP